MSNQNGCPFCPEIPNTTHSAWGMSPEGWESARINHQNGHINSQNLVNQPQLQEQFKYCPHCGKQL